ncbi:MAG: hypothetical protein ACI8TF_002864 [Paracoccaceae bacterium]|jgi:hypothetical protein
MDLQLIVAVVMKVLHCCLLDRSIHPFDRPICLRVVWSADTRSHLPLKSCQIASAGTRLFSCLGADLQMGCRCRGTVALTSFGGAVGRVGRLDGQPEQPFQDGMITLDPVVEILAINVHDMVKMRVVAVVCFTNYLAIR